MAGVLGLDGTTPGPAADAALRSRGILRRFCAAYRGAHPPVDALWWLAHPCDPAPSGSPAPRRAILALQVALAGPNADAELRERHAAALKAIEEDEEAARTALASATRPFRLLRAPATTP
jgi:hypothetical protein